MRNQCKDCNHYHPQRYLCDKKKERLDKELKESISNIELIKKNNLEEEND